MRTRVLVVQPLFSVVLDETGQPCTDSEAVCTSVAQPVGEAVAANGQVIAALAAFLQQAMPLILQMIALFGKTSPAPAPAA